MVLAAALSVVGLSGGGQAYAATPVCDVFTYHDVTFSDISWGPYEEGYLDNKNYSETVQQTIKLSKGGKDQLTATGEISVKADALFGEVSAKYSLTGLTEVSWGTEVGLTVPVPPGVVAYWRVGSARINYDIAEMMQRSDCKIVQTKRSKLFSVTNYSKAATVGSPFWAEMIKRPAGVVPPTLKSGGGSGGGGGAAPAGQLPIYGGNGSSGGAGGGTGTPQYVTVPRFAFTNGAGVIFGKDNRDDGWAVLNPAGHSTATQLEGDRIGAILDGNLFVKDGLYDQWHQLTGGGDVKSFKLSGDRIAFSNGAGVVFAKDGRDSQWATLNPDGRASDFLLDGDRIGAILDGSFYVKDGIYGSWVQLAGGGDVKKISIRGDRFAFTNGAGVIFAKDGRDSQWATLNPDGRASDFLLDGDRIGAILDGSFYVKDGIYGSWVQLAGGGDVKKITMNQRQVRQ
ncbi:hypothetical protein ACOT81_22485 [Streptomyces sp. WI04-05B]|uniref:hypothetical protein n=1 Tax=Streptomyces echiniscabiei TaxID=3028708 RepID=UPI003B99DF23